MDLQLRKIQFVMDFLSINNEQVVNKLEHLLEEEKSKLYSSDIEPLTMEEFNKMIDQAEYDSKINKVKSAYELKKEITTLAVKVLWTNSAIKNLDSGASPMPLS